MHTECDVHGTRLLQRYADYRRLARIAGQVGMRRRDDTTAEAAPVEPRQVEAFLEELLLLCGRGEEYTQYLLARMGEVAAPATLPPARETALRSGAFAAALRELLSYYISLEEYYAEEATAKVGVRAGCVLGRFAHMHHVWVPLKPDDPTHTRLHARPSASTRPCQARSRLPWWTTPFLC